MDKECWLHLRGAPFERLAGSYKPLYIPIGKGHTRLVSCAIHPAVAADIELLLISYESTKNWIVAWEIIKFPFLKVYQILAAKNIRLELQMQKENLLSWRTAEEQRRWSGEVV